jgi:chemotaxis protein histidine kinase CheA
VKPTHKEAIVSSMPSWCAKHPTRAATGTCKRCGKSTCSFCSVEVDGNVFCSVLCFTETTLSKQGKSLKKPPGARGAGAVHDPLASIDFKKAAAPPDPAAALSESSVVLGADQAQPAPEDSSILMSQAEGDPEKSETSILDMGTLRKDEGAPPEEESSILQLDPQQKDPTSILGIGAIHRTPALPSWLDEPPKTETPLPMVLPGTRRSTMQSDCVFHPETPAVVLCSRCGDPICTMCVSDEARGGRCQPRCRRDARARLVRRTGAGVAAAALVALGVWLCLPKNGAPAKTEPPAVDPAAEARAKAKAEALARAEEQAKAEALARAEAQARLDALARAEAEAKAEAIAKAEALERAKAEALAKEAAKAKAEAEAREDARARAEAFASAAAAAKEALAKAEAEAKAKAEAKAEALAKAEAKAREDAEAKAKAEAQAKAEARAKAEALAKARELADFEARAKAEAARRDQAMAGAARQIREATPLYAELAEGLERVDESSDDVKLWVAKIDALDRKLKEARDAYSKEITAAPDRTLLARRIQALDDLRDALCVGLERLGVPRPPPREKR